jgi:hypothetical protein
VKHRLAIHHLPSGSSFFSDPEEWTPEQAKDMSDVVKMAAAGKATYLTIERNGSKTTIPGKLLQDCVIDIQPVGD